MPEETPGSKVPRLSKELKIQKIQALQDFLGVSGNVNFADLDRFQLNLNKKKGNTELKFLNSKDEWVLLTNKRTGEFLAESTIYKLIGINTMKNMLGLDKTPSQSEQSRTAARKLESVIPTDLQMDNISMKDLSRVIINVEHEVRETSQNTDLDMLEVIEPLQRIQREFDNIYGTLKAINEHIEREQQKLDVIKNDSSYTDEQRK